MNPLDLMFRADNAQNRFFKRSVLYSEIKRDAYRRLGRDVGQLARAQQQVVNLLRLGPRERMDAILRNPRAIEKHAQAVLDVLGDYTRFTPDERRILKRGVLFYGFLRYSLRTVFYTLPVKHPIAAGITGMLANLHNEEVRELLGGDEAPWAYARIFFERDGELKSIDLARANPATNQFIDAIQMGPRKGFARLAGLMSPLLAGIADQGYSVSSFTGRPFTGHGDPNYWSGTDADARWRIFVGDLMRTAYPYRVAERVMVGGRGTTDDSLLFAPRFVDYRTSDAQAREAKRIREAGSVPERLTRELLPFLPKPDHTRETVRRIQQRNRRRSSSPFPQMPSSGGLPSMPSFR